MTNKLELYKCNICGNVIEVLVSGDGQPVCCGEEMHRLEAQNDNLNSANLTEKHSPVIKSEDDGKLNIFVTNHPMEEKHYIVFVQAISDDKNEIKTKFFYPGEQVTMESDISSEGVEARSYCNIHGVYVSDKIGAD